MLRYLPFLLVLALWIYAFVDCLNTPEEEVRHLPKVVWVIVILLFGEVLVGPVAWLITGRPRPVNGPTPAQRRHGTAAGWVAPDDNPEFLKSLEKQDKKDDPKNND
ncbi:PLD nuclease N-terminal domain-containing protein [Streptomyces sp. NPDC040750]|uniref:PLD nuclease N-terminal domain-containing protein n=1 Tax=Streptomyces sp. NPDC040750 TaxID=3154491 RepID=UPI0033D0D34F